MKKLPKFITTAALAAAIPAGLLATSGSAWATGLDVNWTQTVGLVTAHITPSPPTSFPPRWCTYKATPSSTHIPIAVPFLFDPQMGYDLALPGIPSEGGKTKWVVEITCDNSGGGTYSYAGSTFY